MVLEESYNLTSWTHQYETYNLRGLANLIQGDRVALAEAVEVRAEEVVRV